METVIRRLALFGAVSFLLWPAVALSRTAQDSLRTFVGQSFILAYAGGPGKIKLKESKLDQVPGSCDLAVLVTGSEWKAGTAHLNLLIIGVPILVNNQAHGCPSQSQTPELEITGFADDDPAEALPAAVRKVLQTPEHFLNSRGIPFDLPPAPDDEKGISMRPSFEAPVAVLRVNGEYTPEARAHRASGAVQFRVVIGRDGRVHHAQLERSLGYGLDEGALRVLSLWRLQPGRQGGQPVAIETHLQMSFRLL